MKRLDLAILGVALASLLVACSSGSSDATTYVKEPVEINETEPVKEHSIGGDAIIIEDGTYVEYGDEAVIVYCNSGGCDVYTGVEIDNSDDSNEDVNNTDRHDTNTSN